MDKPAPNPYKVAMPILVQKYGGTSVGTPERIEAVAERIVAAKARGNDLLVVVSAMGETTDHLIDLARRISPEPPRRELDMLLSAGERISMALLAMALENLLAEHFGLEPPHARAFLPRIRGKTGLPAGRGHERLAIPVPLHRDLRQQQAAMPALLDDEPVPADFDLVGGRDQFERSKDGDFDVDLGELLERHGGEPGIGAARRDRASRDHAPERLVGFDVPDAAAELATMIQRDERSACPRENLGGAGGRRRRSGHPGDQRAPCEAEQQLAVCAAGHRPS